MPYGVPDDVWKTMPDSVKQQVKDVYRNRNTTPAVPKPSTPPASGGGFGDFQVLQEQQRQAAKTGGTPTRTLVGTYNEPGFQSGHSQPSKPITETFKSDPITNQLVPTGQATQPTFDPYRYIKELQDAARSKPTKELRAAMAKELSRID